MRIDVTRAEFDVIVDSLKGQYLRCTTKLREQLARRLDFQLHPSKAPDSNGYAPMKQVSIRSAWPTGMSKPKKGGHWSFQKGAKPRKSKEPPKPQTADDILAEL